MNGHASPEPKSTARRRADGIRPFRSRHLIAVIENPADMRTVGTVVGNVNALGVEKAHVVDTRGALPGDCEEMRERRALLKPFVSASKWSFMRRFGSTEGCIAHLERRNFRSIVTSPHVKGKVNAVFNEVDYTPHPKLAIWFGSESRGIGARAVEGAEMCVSVPMHRMVESLNLGTTLGIILHEVAKQRRAYQSTYRKRNKRRAIGPADERSEAP